MNFEHIRNDWSDKARCAGHPDPDLWHYESSTKHDERELTTWRIAEAKLICEECPVKAQCLEEGLKPENLEAYGIIQGSIWGGRMLGERTKIKTQTYTYAYKSELDLLKKSTKKMDIISK